jgi:RNA polymerase sigma-70 factor (ECF subfamily)
LDFTGFSAEELLLACLRTSDELAWAEFVRRFQPLIASVVTRIVRQREELSLSLVDDLIQETYLKLCVSGPVLLQTFKARHDAAIFGYIKVFTANLVHDHFKAGKAEKRGGQVRLDSTTDDKSMPVELAAPDVTKALERDLLVKQVESCVHKISRGPNAQRDIRVFQLYYRVGLTAGDISKLPNVGLTVKGVESTILRLTQAVKFHMGGQDSDRRREQEYLKGLKSTDSLS